MTRRIKRTVNYRSPSRPSTIEKQNAILMLLARAGEGLSVSELATLLGISRQLCLYHVKKMAATSQLVMQLEPCVGNGGLQFRLWDEEALASHYAETYAPRTAVAA